MAQRLASRYTAARLSCIGCVPFHRRHPVIVRRGGADVAAVIPVEHLELLRELLAQQEAEQRAAQVDWAQVAQVSPPPPQWFEGEEPKPF